MPIRVDLVRTFSNSSIGLDDLTPEAPTGPYAVGTAVGVPTGTTLTATSGLPAADAVETYTITHPVTGASSVLTVSVWRNRHWTSTLTATPPLGATYLFENCLFENTLDNWCVEVGDANYTPNQMVPLAVFDRCTFDGNDSCGRALLAGCTWVIDCHLTGAEDAWGGGYHSVAIRSNFIPTNDGGIDPHQDGIQIAGIGDFTGWQCWMTAGTDPAANSGFRAGTDFSAIANVGLYYCTLSRGGYSLQVRGDAGGRGVTGFRAVGCRWVPDAGFGPVDFEQATIAEWVDNAYTNGTPIPNPVP